MIKIFNFLKNNFLLIIIAIFLVQSFYFSFKLKYGTVPDESYHVIYSVIQSKDIVDPLEENTTESVRILGDISRTTFLYHYLGSFLIKGNVYDIPVFLFLRLFNPILGVLALVGIYKLAFYITKTKSLSYLAVVFMALNVSFVFLNSGVNYDNLINPLAIWAFYFLAKFVDKEKLSDLLWVGILLLLACLTKNTLIPLVVVTVFSTSALLVAKHKTKISVLFKSFAKEMKAKELIPLYIFLAILLGLNFYVYGINVIKYSSYKPGCEKIMSLEECRTNPLYERDYTAGQNANKEATKPHPKDTYTWSRLMAERAFGVAGHGIMYYNKINIAIYMLLFAVPFLYAVATWKKVQKVQYLFAVIGVLYILILFLYNYKGHLTTGEWFGVQGRYVFMVLPIIFISFISNLQYFKYKQYIKYFVLVLIVLLSFFGFTKLALNAQPGSKMDWNKVDDSFQQYFRFMK